GQFNRCVFHRRRRKALPVLGKFPWNLRSGVIRRRYPGKGGEIPRGRKRVRGCVYSEAGRVLLFLRFGRELLRRNRQHVPRKSGPGLLAAWALSGPGGETPAG